MTRRDGGYRPDDRAGVPAGAATLGASSVAPSRPGRRIPNQRAQLAVVIGDVPPPPAADRAGRRGPGAVQPDAAGIATAPRPADGPGSTAGDLSHPPGLSDLPDPSDRPDLDARADGGYRATVPWERPYTRLLIVTDALACVVAVGVAYLVRFGGLVEFDLKPVSARPYILMSVLLPLAWVLSMFFGRAYESRFLGGGSEEFRRVLNAAAQLTAVVAVLSYATKAELARAYVLIAFPAALVLTVALRVGARAGLHRLRRAGRCLHRVLVVGAGESAASMIRIAQREPTAGWSVVGVVLDRSPGRHSHDSPERVGFDLLGVPIVGTSESLHTAIAQTAATTVAISPQMDGERLRRLLWMLEGSEVDVLVSSALTDVTGPRISIRPVAGLPLLHVEEPELSGTRRAMKGLFDRSVAAGILLLCLPLLAALALAVRLTSRGPAIFRQVRVGRGGEHFTMYKFRSMYVDAEQRKAALESRNERAEGLLFKMREDPRITRVGKFLRKWSLDELPQLFNVVGGSMSLVGPRPPLPAEVARYEDDVHRRLMVKPGLTGLWQISGRSDLEWDESVRLDLRYVQNWSLAMDFYILWRTMFAVLRREGAY
ncbi:Undecaprenyl-phosphate glycosyl-1-phosphate transferase [Frankia alni ACN14a]|uniref:Undecaprenyl-phosphate glycosyl-1-phosphate transferase n=1 Tax=Frankia alni (strain DSM 45986 / CECT 9034 / ACN14a) TaxID=326424 RepID=Q0RCU4_FRAAA|nr:Undecaprenyl-phosphate glycosyl-1-phosphate transferase [Frankia alni ACN14a]